MIVTMMQDMGEANSSEGCLWEGGKLKEVPKSVVQKSESFVFWCNCSALARQSMELPTKQTI